MVSLPFRKTLSAAAIFVTALYMSGCASTSTSLGDEKSEGKFIIQYGTLKLIEQSSDINADTIIDTVGRIRAQIEDDGSEVRLVALRAQLLDTLGFDDMTAADRYVVMSVLDNVHEYMDTGIETEFISNDALIRINQFLDWTEQAAMMSR